MVFTSLKQYAMPNLYSKVHRLKRQGWTWDQFLLEIEKIYPAGLEEKTLKAHFRQPHRKASRNIADVIETLHDQCFPSPFPADVEALMRVYQRLLQCAKHPGKDQDIADLNLFVTGELQQPQGDKLLRTARLHWLAANIYFDQLASLRKGSNKNRLYETHENAIEHYTSALSLSSQHNSSGEKPLVSNLIQFKLRQNILACHLNIVEPDQRFQSEGVIKYIQESDFLTKSKEILETEPYQWAVARNGLRFSSITRNRDDCIEFFEFLIKANKYFLDLKYNPVSYPAIIKSQEFDWAVNNVLTEDFLSQLNV